MRFTLKGDEPLDAVVNVRLTAAEKETLKEKADAAGLTLSTYARRRLMNRPVVAHSDVAMIKELRRIGGLLKHIYSETGYGDETSAALGAVKEYIEKLSARA